ncbi:MAG: type II toxin-antitoxin system PemK/MazF family toxin [Candidatus Devosia phytovorans]|uniref:Type II toxin-antitoxin system PemK/MazF family toxin n=1 Tax=Candidatus Devosia phytovorans TaxID=3121372 RepID=A0AAJ5VYH9_9HYPH|nr:type II toxin-antitoxin system PemK/MazF family toxin [Devosia sp.]WEK06792.1 MAG: type II toxin-antitoxin system PemK/MazF family toxin [Devosia sp.]
MRGSLVSAVLPGDTGKPRPAIVLMETALIAVSSRLVILPLTSTLQEASFIRVTIEPSLANGLKITSQAMVDRLTSVDRHKIGQVIGQLEDEKLNEVLGFVLLMMGAR